MAELTLRKISSVTLGKLGELAEKRGRSREDVAVEILEGVLQIDANGRGEMAKRIRAMTPNVAQTDSTEIIRSLRDE